MEYIARHHKDLIDSMTDEQKVIFERFDDCRCEYASLAEEAVFEYTFRLGMKIAIVNKTEGKTYAYTTYLNVLKKGT